jgi:phage host-nuclease inhibitor protein Gam
MLKKYIVKVVSQMQEKEKSVLYEQVAEEIRMRITREIKTLSDNADDQLAEIRNHYLKFQEKHEFHMDRNQENLERHQAKWDEHAGHERPERDPEEGH